MNRQPFRGPRFCERSGVRPHVRSQGQGPRWAESSHPAPYPIRNRHDGPAHNTGQFPRFQPSNQRNQAPRSNFTGTTYRGPAPRNNYTADPGFGRRPQNSSVAQQQQNTDILRQPPPIAAQQQQNTAILRQPPPFAPQQQQNTGILRQPPPIAAQQQQNTGILRPPPPSAAQQQINTGMLIPPPPSVAEQQINSDIFRPPPPSAAQQQLNTDIVRPMAPPTGNGMRQMMPSNAGFSVGPIPPPPFPPPVSLPMPQQPVPSPVQNNPHAFNMPPPNVHTTFAMPPNEAQNIEATMVVTEEEKNITAQSQRDKDITWVEQWLNKHQIKKNELSKSLRSILDPQKIFREALNVLEEFKQQKKTLGNCLNTDNHSEWQQQLQSISKLQEKFNMLQTLISSTSTHAAMMKKIKAIKKTRARLERKKQESLEEEQEEETRREERVKKFDVWRNKMLQKEEEKKRAIELKKAADKTLAEVRKKLADANKSLELVKAMKKLRSARKDSMQRKGLYTPREIDDNFNEKSSKLIEMLSCQLVVYEAEQKTLEVMLETEQEESLEKERELLKIREDLRQKREETKIRRMLFGKEDIPDEIFPYTHYYEAAENDFNSLIHIRRSWDMYLVPPGTAGATSIPPNWVLPTKPSNDTWSSAAANTS